MAARHDALIMCRADVPQPGMAAPRYEFLWHDAMRRRAWQVAGIYKKQRVIIEPLNRRRRLEMLYFNGMKYKIT
jgi:hypothetical protein